MATPLIEVIEECEQDIATFRKELGQIITDADADGVRDEEEKKEIDNFETSIADLEKFAQEKRTEFEKNKAEWDGLSSKVSELMADFQTLTDWGEPNLQTVDNYLTEMDQNAGNQFYRDAIIAFEAAQSNNDPLMEEYNKQSAAKLTYDEDIASAVSRVETCRKSENLDRDIEARLDQVEADFDSCRILIEKLDYETALSSLQSTIEEISNIETMLEQNAQAEDRVGNLWGELLTKRSEVLEKLEPHRDLLDEFLEDFSQREATFNALVNDKYFEQAEDWIQQTEDGFSSTIDKVTAREEAEKAEQEKREAEEALLAQEQEKLAADLSAAPPKETLWKLFQWRSGDSFDKLAKDCGVNNADVLLDFPNNKKLAAHYRANGDLPDGTLVCIVDDSIEICQIEINGKTYVVTKDNLDEILAGNQKFMVDAAASYRAGVKKLIDNQKIAYDARTMFPVVTEYMTGWANEQPTTERDAADAAVKKVESLANSDQRDSFVDAASNASKLCATYHKALVDWLNKMQTDLADTMWWVGWGDTIATATAMTLIITISAPGSLPALALYSFVAAAEISVLKDVTRNATIERFDLDLEMIDGKTIAMNAAYSGAVAAGVAFFVAGPAFKLLSKTLLASVSTTSPTSFQPIVNKIIEAMAKRGITIPVSTQARIIDVCWKKFVYRLGAGTLKGIAQPRVEKYFSDKKEEAATQNPDATAVKIADCIVDDQFLDEFCTAMVNEHGAEIEDFVTNEVEMAGAVEE